MIHILFDVDNTSYKYNNNQKQSDFKHFVEKRVKQYKLENNLRLDALSIGNLQYFEVQKNNVAKC